MKVKRLIISTVLGVVFGFICYGLAASGQTIMPTALAISIILSRTAIGVAIGISRFPMKHWTIHGLVMGFVFSLPGGFAAMAGPENPDYSNTMLFIMTIVMGMIYGLLIELFTTVVFKAKQ